MDIVGNSTLKQFRNSRGKHSSYKSWGLFFTDLASGLSVIQLMDGSTSQDVTRAITAFANKNKIPAKIVVDAGPQLKTLANNPLFDATTAMGIPVESVAAGHQFLNFAERHIHVWKGLMSSMKRNQNKTIYDQEETMLDLYDLQGKLTMVYKVMSL